MAKKPNILQVSYCLNITLVSTQTSEVSNSLTIEEMYQDQPLLSHQTLTNTAKTRLEKEQTTNREGV